MLVKIANTDITKYILSSTYDVNEENVIKEWTDANYVTHRNVIRQKVLGSFDLKFNKEEEYSAFCALIRERCTAEYLLPVTLYVVNKNEERDTQVFFEYQPKLVKNLSSGKSYKEFTFEVEEP